MTNFPFFALACLSGIMLGGAYPSVGLGYFAFAALIPLFTVLRNTSPARVLLWSFVAGFVFHCITMFWMQRITWAGMLCAIPILSFFFALPFAVSSIVYKRFPRLGFAVLPFAVAGVEWIRSFDVLAFPWMVLGNSQSAYPFFTQFADITSVYGISAWIVAVNISMYTLIGKKTVRTWLFFTALFVLPITYSLLTIHRGSSDSEEITVALIQGNVMPEEKWRSDLEYWNVNLYCTMSADAMEHEPDLIVWPETATPVYLLENPLYRHKVQALVDTIGVPVLTGMPSVDFSTGETWNSAGLFLPQEKIVQRYKKLHLVPFGEAIPFNTIFPALRKLNLGQANWETGTDPVVFRSDFVPPFATLICFESIFPDLVQRFVKQGLEFLVVITNDVWFGPGTAPEQHAMISTFRAIESHKPVIRCANTGISMLIDPYGRVLKQTKAFERTTLVGTITPSNRQTFYMRHGNLFSFASTIFTLICLLMSLLKKYRYTERTA
ncbi:apolipoprotein N-acyltransferase [Candidatus Latescibacterota bacterium]